MSDDVEVDLPLTGAQALKGHETEVTVARRVLVGTQWTLSDKVFRLRVPVGVAPRTVLRLPGMGHARADGSAGDVLIRVLIDEALDEGQFAQELRLSPGDAARGVTRTVDTVMGRLVVEVPAGATDGIVLKISNLFLRLRIDPLLADSPAETKSGGVNSGRRWTLGVGIVFALYGFIGAFALPFSDLGKQELFIDGRFFVLGFGGLAIAIFGVEGGVLRGRRKAVALTVAAAFLVAVCAATWGLILLLGRFGYSLRF